MSQKLIEQELIDPLPTMMPKWTSLMRYMIQNNIKIMNDDKNHDFTEDGRNLQERFEVSYMNHGDLMCLCTEGMGGFDSNGGIPYTTTCCGEFPYGQASKALLSWDNFIQYKVDLYDHIIQNHPNMRI